MHTRLMYALRLTASGRPKNRFSLIISQLYDLSKKFFHLFN